MKDSTFDGMVLFCAVVDAGGFTAAARELGHSVSHVSKEVARLEARLGTRLLNRTTRTVSLTESGRIYFDNARQIVRDAEAIDERIRAVGDKPAGRLRLSVAVMFASAYLNRWLPDFLETYPDIDCDIEVSDRTVNIVAEGLDAVVRAGHLADADMIARELMKTRQMTVASPAYLEAHDMPAHPRDLVGHTLIDFSYRALGSVWTYAGRGGKTISVPVEPRVTCDSADMELALALGGTGITRLPHLVAEGEIARGELVPLLEDFETEPLGIYVVYPSRAHLAPKVRALVDFLAAKCTLRSSGPD